MAEFKIVQEEYDDVTQIINVDGFLDAHTYEQLEGVMNNLFNNGKYKIIVDLNKLDYISSAGAGVFIGAIGLAQEKGGNIVLVNPTKNVQEVLDLLGLSQIFTIVNSVDAGIKSFQ